MMNINNERYENGTPVAVKFHGQGKVIGHDEKNDNIIVELDKPVIQSRLDHSELNSLANLCGNTLDIGQKIVLFDQEGCVYRDNILEVEIKFDSPVKLISVPYYMLVLNTDFTGIQILRMMKDKNIYVITANYLTWEECLKKTITNPKFFSKSPHIALNFETNIIQHKNFKDCHRYIVFQGGYHVEKLLFKQLLDSPELSEAQEFWEKMKESSDEFMKNIIPNSGGSEFLLATLVDIEENKILGKITYLHYLDQAEKTKIYK